MIPAAPLVPSASSPELLRLRLLRDLLPLIAVAEQSGVDIDGLLARLGLTRQRLRDPSARLPAYQVLWLTQQLIAAAGDPEIGLRVAEHTPLGKAEALGHLLQHFVQVSPSIFAVLDLLARFVTRVSESNDIRLIVEDGRVTIRMVPLFTPPAELFDAVAGSSRLLIQKLGGESLHPLEVRLPRPVPARPAHYEQFFGAPVHFDADCLELVYAQEALNRSPSNMEELFRGQASSNAAAVPAKTRTASAFVEQVQAHVLGALTAGVPVLPNVAKTLGVSARTLRRRLLEARTTYVELVDEVRRRRALILANRAELDVARLAELTGFADASSFARAFRRWTGRRPAEFMRRQREKS